MASSLDVPFSTAVTSPKDPKLDTGVQLSVSMPASTVSTDSDSMLDPEDQQSRTYFPPPPPNLNSRRKPYPCNVPGCSRTYMTLRNLQCHQNYHPTSFLCRYIPCAGAFVSLIDRTIHEVNYHGKSTLLQCHLCPYNSPNREGVRGHIKRQHPEVDIQVAMSWVVHGEGPGGDNKMHKTVGKPRDKTLWLTCNLCGMRTEREANMYQHLWRNHRGEKTPRMVLLENMKIERDERVKAGAKTHPNYGSQIGEETEEDEDIAKIKIEEEDEDIRS